MTEAVKRQLEAAGVKVAGGKAKSPAAGPKRTSTKKTTTQPADEQEEPTPLPLAEPQPRYYRSSATVEGLGSARLVGFSEDHWTQLVPMLAQLGFRPY